LSTLAAMMAFMSSSCSRRSPDGAKRNPGSTHTANQDPDYAPLHPGYSLGIECTVMSGRRPVGKGLM
jgi:hypothetical protein